MTEETRSLIEYAKVETCANIEAHFHTWQIGTSDETVRQLDNLGVVWDGPRRHRDGHVWREGDIGAVRVVVYLANEE